ncbi:Uncharacterised protein [uncultured archaeon]|nr:Uncharacterised protein [uncultured archaeon]
MTTSPTIFPGDVLINSTGASTYGYGVLTLSSAASCNTFIVNTNKFRITVSSGDTYIGDNLFKVVGATGQLNIGGNVAVNSQFQANANGSLYIGTNVASATEILFSVAGTTGTTIVGANKFQVAGSDGGITVGSNTANGTVSFQVLANGTFYLGSNLASVPQFIAYQNGQFSGGVNATVGGNQQYMMTANGTLTLGANLAAGANITLVGSNGYGDFSGNLHVGGDVIVDGNISANFAVPEIITQNNITVFNNGTATTLSIGSATTGAYLIIVETNIGTSGVYAVSKAQTTDVAAASGFQRSKNSSIANETYIDVYWNASSRVSIGRASGDTGDITARVAMFSVA